MGLVIEIRHNTIASTLFGSNMKEIDDTPLHENESEDPIEAIWEILEHLEWNKLKERLEKLELRIANLETQRTPQDENDDAEWY